MRVFASLIILVVCTAALVWLFTSDWDEPVDRTVADVRRPQAEETPTSAPAIPGVEFRRQSTFIVGFEETDFPFLADEDSAASISMGTG